MNQQTFVFLTLVFFSFAVSANVAKAKPYANKDLSKETLLIELTGKDVKKITEEELYADIVTAFRNGNEIALKSKTHTFLKRFPRSHFSDNALFLSGSVALQNKNYSDALRSFQRISKSYPNSNKAVSAQFSKGVTYRKLQLDAEARRVFRELITKYPGSPESFRAEAELKLIN